MTENTLENSNNLAFPFLFLSTLSTVYSVHYQNLSLTHCNLTESLVRPMEWATESCYAHFFLTADPRFYFETCGLQTRPTLNQETNVSDSE